MKRGRAGTATVRAGRARGKKACELGQRCPYLHEHQHLSEYSHEDTQAAVKGRRTEFGGVGVRLDAAVDDEPAGARKCTYCKRAGHTITTCEASGADAERRRRGARRQARLAAVPSKPQALGTAAVVPHVALPSEYLSRQRVRAEGPAVRATLRDAQDAAYEAAALADRQARDAADALAKAHQLRAKAQQLRAEQRAALQASEPVEGVSMRFRLPGGVTLQRRFEPRDTLAGAVFAYLSAQDELFAPAWRVVSALSQSVLMRVAPSSQLRRAQPGSVESLALRNASLMVVVDDDDDGHGDGDE